MATPTPLSPPRTRTKLVRRTTAPPPQSAAMAACIMGVAKEVLEARTAEGAANTAARVSVAASIIGTDTGATKDVADLSIRCAINGDATAEVTFPSSPSGGEISTRLVTNLLDAGLSGVGVTKDAANQVTFTTTERGDGASLKMLRAKVRVTHGTVADGPFVVGDELMIQSTSAVVGTVSKRISATQIVLDLSAGTAIPVAADVLLRTGGGTVPTATVTAVHSAYDALGVAEFEALVEGTSTYRNRSHRIAFESLPVSMAPSAAGLIFDTTAMGLLRSEGGRLSEFGLDSATLRSRSHQATQVLDQARATYPSGSAHTNTTVTYTSVGTAAGSDIAVTHRPAIRFAITGGSFTAGKLLRNTTPSTDEIVGIILSTAESGYLTVALYGVAPSSGDTITDGAVTNTTSSAAAVVTVPDVRVESRIFRLAFTDAVAFTEGATLTNRTVGAGQYTIGTILHAVTSGATRYIVVELAASAGYPATIGSIVGDGSVTATVTAITALADARLVVAYVGSTGMSAAMVAGYVNSDVDAQALVRAEVGGSQPGSGTCDSSGAIVRLSPISTASSGAASELKFVGYPWDDRDGDSKTPYFWTKGALATASVGTGASAVVFTAKGGQTITDRGNYHGAAGNAITVRGIDAPVSAVVVSVAGTAITIFYRGPQNSSTHTAADIVAAIGASAAASALVVATAATGTGSPTGWATTSLTGGLNPLNFQQAPAAAIVTGERTLENFGYIKVSVASASGFLPGEMFRLTGASGSIAGIIRSVDTVSNVLWVDPVHHRGTVAANPSGSTDVKLDAVDARLVDDYFNGWNVRTLSGTGSGQTRLITDYTGSTRVATVSAWSSAIDNTTTYALEAPGEITTGATVYGSTSASSTVVTAVVQEGVVAGETIEFRYKGGLLRTVTLTATSDLNDVLSQINTSLGLTVAFLSANTASPLSVLELRATGFDAEDAGGIESTIELSGSAVEKVLGLQPRGRVYTGAHEGLAFKSLVGDELWAGTTRLGRIVSVDSLVIGSQTFSSGLLKIDSDTLSTTATWSNWWVKAKNLTLASDLSVQAVDGAARPTPGLRIDADGSALLVAHAQARRTDGTISNQAQQPMYVDYAATRTDLSGSLLEYGDLTELEAALSPVSPLNPLAWGVYAALLNSGNFKVTAVAVDETSAAYPDGTIDAYERAMSYLNDRSYAIVPLTQDRDVLAFIANSNDDVAAPADSSDVVQASRLVLLNHAQPSESEPTIVGSGTGTLTAINVIEVDPDTMNVVSELVAAGFESPEDMTWSDFKTEGVYLTATTRKGKFSVSSVDGQIITVVTDPDSFEPDDNSDNFYTEAVLDPDALDFDTSGETVTLWVRGAAFDIASVAGKTALLTAMGEACAAYDSRRVRYVCPDVAMTYNGTDQVVKGYFGACALAGAFSANKPQTTYFSFPLAGLTDVSGSSDIFKPAQLNQGAGYGIWWLTKEGESVVCRDQPTTKASPAEDREHSIVQALDWFERLVRNSVRRGPDDNITPAYLEVVSVTLSGAAQYAREQGVLDAALTGVSQNVVNPRQVDASFTVQVLQPARELAITIAI